MYCTRYLIALFLVVCAAIPVFAAAPVVKTVPAFAGNAAIPHDTIPNKAITLKGTSSIQGPDIQATWDFGDASSSFVSNVSNQYDVSATHIYSGSAGSIFTAKLTVRDTRTGESSSALYRVAMRETSLSTEVNIALDEALWYLHRTMFRTLSGASYEGGGWRGPCGFVCDDKGAVNAANVLAFELNGFIASGDPDNPYIETVARAMNTLFDQSSDAALRNDDWVDAIVAANNPGNRAITGPGDVAGRTFQEIVDSATAAGAVVSISTAAHAAANVVQLALRATATDAAGSSSDTIARALIDSQDALGFWTGHNPPAQASFETSRSVVTLAKSFPRAIGAGTILNVSTQVSVTTTGFGYNRVARTFNGTMTVTNTSASPITGPIDVVLTNLTAGVTLVNGNGSFNGNPYLVMPGVTTLNPGQSANVALSFSNPGSVRIDFTAVTYSGTFPPAPVTLSCPAVTGTNGVAYSSSFLGAGGVQPYTYSVGPGTLPTGLTFDTTTGAITGTPSANGPFTFTANVADATGLPSGTANTSCTITISPASAPLALSCPATTGQVGVAYSSALVATGGTPGYTYAISAGSLPSPLILNPATGAITGTPNTAGPNSFTGQVTDSTSGTPLTTTANCSIAISLATTVAITVQTSPAGQSFTVDGTTFTSTQVVNWVPGTLHTISTTSPQGSGGTRFVFNNWSDGGAISHSVTAPAAPATFTASFDTQFQLTTAALPVAGGTVTPAPGSFFAAGSVQNVQATPNANFSFTNWTGPVASATSASTTVTMSGPVSITANFAANVNVTVQTSPSGQSFTVDGTTFTTTQVISWVPGSSHTISTTSPQGSGGTRFVFNNWSDGGAISHSVTAPTLPATFTAAFDTQFQLTTAASPGAGGTVTPASGSFFAAGSVQNVQATPNSGFAFNGWSGPVASATSASTTVTMSGPITVTANFAVALALSCPAATNAPIGTLYSSSLVATGGTTAYTYSIQTGTLPPPLLLTPSSGLISGTPTTKGTYNFVAKVVDSTSPIQQTATANCSILVPNRPPAVTSQSVTTAEDTAKVITMAGSDPDGDALTFIIVTNPAHGSLGSFGAVSCSGTPSNCTRNVTYTPNANFNGSDSFTFKVNDGTIDSAANATVSITITAVNDAPVAVNHLYAAQANMKVSIAAAGGLLTGATDPDSADAGFTLVLTVGTVSATNPAGGTVTVNAATGALDFDPPAGVTGNVTFTYTVCDNGNPLPSLCSAPAAVTVNVTGPVIWFANLALGSNGTGTLANPFNTLAAANTALGSNTNQRIFLFSGTAASGTNVTLAANDWLVGQGVTGASFDAVMGISPPLGTIARPAIAGTAPIVQGTVNMNGSNTEVLGLRIQPSSGSPGLAATLAGPFTGLVVSDIPLISTTNARAVNLNNVSGVFTITSVSATGSDIGINLSAVNPSTGSFSVIGGGGVCTATTPTCTGGTISGSTNIGVNLANANNVSLTRMRVRNSTHFGLRGATVAVLKVDTSVFDGTSGTGSLEGVFFVTNWLTSGTIGSSEILGGSGDNVNVHNSQGTLNRLTVSNTIIRDNNTASGNDGLNFSTILAPAAGSGVVMNITVTGCTFQRHRGDHFQTDAQGLSSMDVIFSSNTLSGGDPTTLGDTVLVSDSDSSHVTLDFNGNHINGALLSAYTFFQPNTTTATASLIGKFRNNFVGTTGVAGSGSAQGDGVAINATGLGTITMNVTGNDIRQYAEFGINMSAGDTSPHLNATVTGNTVKEPFSVNALQGIIVNAGTTAAGTVVACADIGGAGALANNATGAGGNGFSDFRLRQRNSSTVQLPGLTGAVDTFIQGRNTAGATVTFTGTFGNNGGLPCPQAP